MVSSKMKVFIFSLLLTMCYGVSAFNITKILDSNPTYSAFNDYLTRTKIAHEINSRKSVTVLAVSNSVMSSIYGNSTAAIKNILSVHILLDIYDDIKLHNLKVGANVTSTTLYQTTGVAQDHTGEVNITLAKSGDVTFSSAQPGSRPGPKLVKEITHLGSDLAVLEVSDLIIVRSLLTSGPPDVNITAVAEAGGCRTFASLITSSGVVKTYMKQAGSEAGITVFAPKDAAFTKKGLPDLSNVSDADLVSLLLFHALNNYAPISTLKSSKGGLKTLAPSGNYGLTATADGGVVTLHTGVDASAIITTLKDEIPVVVYAVDSVLLPEELFGTPASPSEAPSPAANTPAESPKGKSKRHAPAKSPDASPPAPPSDEDTSDGGSGGGGFVDGPGGDDDAVAAKDGKKSGAVTRNVSMVLTVVVLVFSFVILS
ncbi:hypothetical protein vseg_009277 [Gypsophila vaccaria]